MDGGRVSSPFIAPASPCSTAGATLHAWRRPDRAEISGFIFAFLAPTSTAWTAWDRTFPRNQFCAVGRGTQANSDCPKSQCRVTKPGDNDVVVHELRPDFESRAHVPLPVADEFAVVSEERTDHRRERGPAICARRCQRGARTRGSGLAVVRRAGPGCAAGGVLGTAAGNGAGLPSSAVPQADAAPRCTFSGRKTTTALGKGAA